MSAVASGITYGLRFDTGRMAADITSAEGMISAHVAKMNALRINIPAALDLTQFKTQAADIDTALAKWAAGVTIPVNIGGGAGVGGNTVVNNSVANNLNNTVNNAVTNLLNTINNTVQNTINNVTNNAAAGGGGGGGGGGLMGYRGGFGRFLSAYALVSGVRHLERESEAFHEGMINANSPEDVLKAQIQRTRGNDQLMFGLGRPVRALVENSGLPGTSLDDLEMSRRELTLQDRAIGRQFQQVGTMGHLSDQIVSGNVRLRHDRGTAATSEAAIQLGSATRETNLKYARERMELAKEQDATEAKIASGDLSGNAVYKEHARLEDRKNEIEDNAKAELEAHRKIFDQKVKEAEFDRKELEFHRGQEQSGQSAEGSAAGIRGRAVDALGLGTGTRFDVREAGRQAERILFERRQDAELAEQADRERTERGGRQDPAARAALDKKQSGERAEFQAKQQQEEEQDRREREKAEQQSVDRVIEIRTRGAQASLMLAGETQRAELLGFQEAQRQRVASLETAINAEVDADRKRQLIAQRDAERQAQGAQLAEFRRRQEMELAREQAGSQVRVAGSQDAAVAYYLRGQGQEFRAGEAQFQSGWNRRVRAAEDAVRNEPDAERRRQRQAELEALVGERTAAGAERRGVRERQGREYQFETRQIETRAAGLNYTAQIEEIRHRARRDIEEQEGNPEQQQRIRRRESSELQLLKREISMRAGGMGQTIQGVNRTDLLGRYGNPDPNAGKETVDVLKNNIDVSLQAIKQAIVDNANKVTP